MRIYFTRRIKGTFGLCDLMTKTVIGLNIGVSFGLTSKSFKAYLIISIFTLEVII